MNGMQMVMQMVNGKLADFLSKLNFVYIELESRVLLRIGLKI